MVTHVAKPTMKKIKIAAYRFTIKICFLHLVNIRLRRDKKKIYKRIGKKQKAMNVNVDKFIEPINRALTKKALSETVLLLNI